MDAVFTHKGTTEWLCCMIWMFEWLQRRKRKWKFHNPSGKSSKQSPECCSLLLHYVAVMTQITYKPLSTVQSGWTLTCKIAKFSSVQPQWETELSLTSETQSLFIFFFITARQNITGNWEIRGMMFECKDGDKDKSKFLIKCCIIYNFMNCWAHWPC